MALGFILFAIFFIIVLFITIIAVIILLICRKNILKYKKDTKGLKFIVSIIGTFISSIILIFIIFNIIRIFILPTITTQIMFKTMNNIKDINNIVRIEQFIDSGHGTHVRFHYLKEYREIIPSRYNLVFRNVSDDVDYIKINSIYMIIGGEEKNVIKESGGYGFGNEKNKYLYNIKFDYRATESFIIIYNIDINLKNGERMNIEEKEEYVKEINYIKNKK